MDHHVLIIKLISITTFIVLVKKKQMLLQTESKVHFIMLYMQVLPTEIESIRGNEVFFRDGKSLPFDSIIFCTGFKRTTQKWLKVYVSD